MGVATEIKHGDASSFSPLHTVSPDKPATIHYYATTRISSPLPSPRLQWMPLSACMCTHRAAIDYCTSRKRRFAPGRTIKGVILHIQYMSYFISAARRIRDEHVCLTTLRLGVQSSARSAFRCGVCILLVHCKNMHVRLIRLIFESIKGHFT